MKRNLPCPEQAEKNPPQQTAQGQPERKQEYGGRKGPEPTRYGDWENAGKCVDF